MSSEPPEPSPEPSSTTTTTMLAAPSLALAPTPGREPIMPDSRLRGAARGRRGLLVGGRNHVPVYCANCGKPEGLVPEENMTFAFVLCQPCADAWGDRVHFYLEPDAVFWRRVHEEQMAAHDRAMTTEELLAALTDEGSSMSKMFREHDAEGRSR